MDTTIVQHGGQCRASVVLYIVWGQMSSFPAFGRCCLGWYMPPCRLCELSGGCSWCTMGADHWLRSIVNTLTWVPPPKVPPPILCIGPGRYSVLSSGPSLRRHSLWASRRRIEDTPDWHWFCFLSRWEAHVACTEMQGPRYLLCTGI